MSCDCFFDCLASFVQFLKIQIVIERSLMPLFNQVEKAASIHQGDAVQAFLPLSKLF